MGEVERKSRSSALGRRSLIWYLLVRIAVITLFLGGTFVFQWRSGRVFETENLLFLISLSYLQAIIAAALLPKVRRLLLFAQIQVVWDLLFVTTLIYVTGAIHSIFSFLFILVIISSSLFLSRKDVLLVASASAILYGSLLDLQFYGYIATIGYPDTTEVVSGTHVLYALFINVSSFYLTAFLTISVAHRLRVSEQALFEQKIDYEELNLLNTSILQNINTGIMILDSSRKIRSFNAGASKITGFSLADVYDKRIDDLFPGLKVSSGDDFLLISRGEGSFAKRDGRKLILGYATSMIEDPQGNGLKLLITFQDLTGFKSMEEQLKRSDRLAAVGRLASGMAHEIRNPLASISGSIQLLMETAELTREETKLMEIVVKEANRLSTLLTDFLLFARPRPPELTSVDICALIDETLEILTSDPRFSKIEIEREFSAGISLMVDRQQMRQALWNLIINAAEAMPSGGKIIIGVQDSCMYVEDSGGGVPVHIRDRIFDPFFTTKDYGSGLGLATVYAIVEGHGGRIEVGVGRAGGSRFSIHLPVRQKNA